MRNLNLFVWFLIKKFLWYWFLKSLLKHDGYDDKKNCLHIKVPTVRKRNDVRKVQFFALYDLFQGLNWLNWVIHNYRRWFGYFSTGFIWEMLLMSWIFAILESAQKWPCLMFIFWNHLRFKPLSYQIRCIKSWPFYFILTKKWTIMCFNLFYNPKFWQL